MTHAVIVHGTSKKERKKSGTPKSGPAKAGPAGPAATPLDGDLAHGQWCATIGKFESCTIWADASDISIGVAIELDGSILEDRSWLRPYDDKRHINIVELEAAIRGLSLVVDW